jgi:AcrR family transcriptional regulator
MKRNRFVLSSAELSVLARSMDSVIETGKPGSPAAPSGPDSQTVAPATARPRVEGAREGEILDAALALLVDVGYDKLTLDAVATASRSSKATLYRRWASKADLVVDALCRAKDAPQVQLDDTGTLRGDLIAMACGHGGLGDASVTAVMASVITALHRDREFADAFYHRFIAAKLEDARRVFARAAERGEIRDDLDLDLIPQVLPAVILHRVFVLQQPVDDDLVLRIIDQVVLPAATVGGRCTAPTATGTSPVVAVEPDPTRPDTPLPSTNSSDTSHEGL